MNERIIIIGSGGQGKIIADIVLKNHDIVAGFLDDGGSSPDGFEYLGRIDDYKNYPDCKLIIAIGTNSVRKDISKRLEGVSWYTAIHPTASISAVGAKIGEGSMVGAFAVIGPDAAIGSHAIINTAVDVEHDCRVGDFSHISPNATLCGTVKIGSLVHIGAGAVIKNNTNVCDEVTVGVGAAVVKNITSSGVYVGVPAKKIR